VLHQLQHTHQAVAAINDGLPIILGNGVLSTDLVNALSGPVPGDNPAMARALILRVPTDRYLGAPGHSTVIVDREQHAVSGYPSMYVNVRRNLAMYDQPDVEVARAQIESDAASGYILAEHPAIVVEPQYVVGSLLPKPSLLTMLAQLRVPIDAWQELDYDRFVTAIVEFFEPAAINRWGVPEVVLTELIQGTIEATAIRQLRGLRIQGLAALGYQMPADGMEIVKITRDEQRDQLRRLEGRLDNPLFVGELAWLRDFAATELRIMRLELDESAQIR
jgi:hypothetical protein